MNSSGAARENVLLMPRLLMWPIHFMLQFYCSLQMCVAVLWPNRKRVRGCQTKNRALDGVQSDNRPAQSCQPHTMRMKRTGPWYGKRSSKTEGGDKMASELFQHVSHLLPCLSRIYREMGAVVTAWVNNASVWPIETSSNQLGLEVGDAVDPLICCIDGTLHHSHHFVHNSYCFISENHRIEKLQ